MSDGSIKINSSQRFTKNIDSESRLSLTLYDIDKNTKLEDILNEVKKFILPIFLI